MVKLAAKLVIFVLVINLLLAALFGLLPASASYSLSKSPRTGICYETRTAWWVTGPIQSRSPVEDRFCTDQKPPKEGS